MRLIKLRKTASARVVTLSMNFCDYTSDPFVALFCSVLSLTFLFFFSVADKDEEMAEFAKSVLQKTLNVKYPDFFAIHFSECILVMNGCTGKN